jgi:hypothetical protein
MFLRLCTWKTEGNALQMPLKPPNNFFSIREVTGIFRMGTQTIINGSWTSLCVLFRGNVVQQTPNGETGEASHHVDLSVQLLLCEAKTHDAVLVRYRPG